MPGSFAVERRLRGFLLSTFAAHVIRIRHKNHVEPGGRVRAPFIGHHLWPRQRSKSTSRFRDRHSALRRIDETD
jgi:hypothetical protein